MLLLTGPPASGKTSFCLRELREALREGRTDCRLLVPTTTMAEHLRNELAREGLVFSPRVVSTFGKFVGDYCADLRSVSPATFALIVEHELGRLPLERYAAVRRFPGFRSAVAAAIEEFSGAGGTVNHIGLLDKDFQEVWQAVTAAVRGRGEFLRADRLLHATKAILAGSSFGQLWVAGFYDFTPAELEIVAAMAERSQLVVALADSPGAEQARSRLRAIARQEMRFEPKRAARKRILSVAPSPEAEAGDIACRILELHRGGKAFREMGIIARSEQPSVPAICAALERWGIPYRSYFAPLLRSHPVVRYLLALVDAALSGWNHEQSLEALRMRGSPLESSGDQWEFQILKQLPAIGFDSLRERVPGEAQEYLDQLANLHAWVASPAVPAVWSKRFAALPAFFSPGPVTDQVSPERVLLWKTDYAAIEQFGAAAEQAAAALDSSREVSLIEFRDAVKTAIETMPVRVVDRRRDVVHVMDVVEARQWQLPVVFVCGLIETQFPRHHSENPIIGDHIRRQLQNSGLPLRTTADRQRDEEFLFDVALTRASDLLVLSYAQLNWKGEPHLPSHFLERAQPYTAEPAIAALPPAIRALAPEPLPAILDEGLRTGFADRHRVMSVSRIEAFIRCPWSFFADRILKLQERPEAPFDRLNAVVKGTIAHKVFEIVFRDGMPVEAAFEEIFRENCRDIHVPDGYRTEAIRLELLDGVEKLANDPRMTVGAGNFRFEEPFQFKLTPELTIEGKIDRIDLDRDGKAIIFDYKYRRAYRIAETVRENEAGEKVQSGLYLLAAQSLKLQPAGMVYSGYKREASFAGWVIPGLRPELKSACSPADLEAVVSKARETSLMAHSELINGSIRPKPLDDRVCEFCSFDTICRIETVPETATAEASSAE